jgi:uncharacterized delta-60 repeat protein
MTIKMLAICFIALMGLRVMPEPAFAGGGDLDKTFGTKGIATLCEGEAPPFVRLEPLDTHAVVIQPDGKVVAVGFVPPAHIAANMPGVIALVRWDDKGKLDTSFGSGGVVFTSVKQRKNIDRDHVDTTERSEGWAIAIQPDGNDFHIIVGGRTGPAGAKKGKSVFVLARYDKTGALDKNFGTDNTGIIAPENLFDDRSAYLTAIAIQPWDGKIVAVGYAGKIGDDGTLGPASFAVARFDRNGVPDSGFGKGGGVFTPPAPPFVNVAGGSAFANAITFLDRIIVVAGEADLKKILVDGKSVINSTVAIVGYDDHGQPDPSFGDKGQIISGILLGKLGSTNQLNISAHAIAIEDGKIVVAGTFYLKATTEQKMKGGNDSTSFLLVRYDPIHKGE